MSSIVSTMARSVRLGGDLGDLAGRLLDGALDAVHAGDRLANRFGARGGGAAGAAGGDGHRVRRLGGVAKAAVRAAMSAPERSTWEPTSVAELRTWPIRPRGRRRGARVGGCLCLVGRTCGDLADGLGDLLVAAPAWEAALLSCSAVRATASDAP